jgi:hypothetical protein
MKPLIPKPGMERGQGAIILCAVLWSTSGLCIKLLDWHPIGGGLIIAAVAVSPILVSLKRSL